MYKTYNERPLHDTNSQTHLEMDPCMTTNTNHKNITDFGDFANEYSNTVHAKRKKERTILKDLEKYHFTPDIKERANKIYQKMKETVYRGNKRKQLLYYCVYNAHLELGIATTNDAIGEVFGLTEGEIVRCDSIFAPLQTGYKPPRVEITPMAYLPSYCDKLGLSEEMKQEMLVESDNIMGKSKSLRNGNPKTVAAGLLKYLMFTHGIPEDDDKPLSEITKRSNVTISNMYDMVSVIDNKY